MAVIGDVIQLTLQGSYLGEEWLNVFYYRVQDNPTPDYLAGLSSEFQTNVLTAMASIQTNAVSYLTLTARNIFGSDEYQDTSLSPATGVPAAVQSLPSILSLSFKLVRSNTRVRHGRKSILGQHEEYSDGQNWSAPYMGNARLAAPKFAQDLLAGLTDSFRPVIVGRVLDADPISGKPFYRLPVSQAEMGDRWAYVIGAQPSSTIRTMNSRRP